LYNNRSIYKIGIVSSSIHLVTFLKYNNIIYYVILSILYFLFLFFLIFLKLNFIDSSKKKKDNTRHNNPFKRGEQLTNIRSNFY